MLKQTIKGLQTLNVSVTGSDADLTSLVGVLAGKVEQYKSVGNGGVAIAAIPSPLNRKVLIVGDKDPTGRLSTMVTIPHVKAASTFSNLLTDIVGVFDSGYDSSIKCEYAKLKFDA